MSGLSGAHCEEPAIVKANLPSKQSVYPGFSLQHEASMCCVALRFRHSPKVLLPHNLSLLNKALHSEFSHFQDHMSYLSKLMLEQGGQRHSDNRPFTKSEDDSILALYYQTNQKMCYITNKPDEKTCTLPPPLPLAAVLHANGYLPQPPTTAMLDLSRTLQCKVENIATRYKQLETKLILSEVAHQEQHQQSEEGDIFDVPVDVAANRPCTTEAVACIVRRARRFVTAVCTDYNGNRVPSNSGNSNSSRKRSYDAYTSGIGYDTDHSGGSDTAHVDAALSCGQLEKIFAGTGNSSTSASNSNKRGRTEDSTMDASDVEDNAVSYWKEASHGSGSSASSDVSSEGGASSIELSALEDEDDG